ncbi:hypothetical protein MUP77_17375 [Candidatus Bathyarchaeota archaeon]|nr:hypothetical protein [Candidatus Bathyarchaeota archaeon]
MDWCYIAGFFDGEGSVFFGYKYPNGKTVRLQVVNTNLEVIEVIKNFIDCRTVRKSIREGNRKPIYECAITNHENCLRIAKQLLPYCIVKKEKLEALIKFIEGNSWVKKPLQIPKEKLQELYWEKQMTLEDIGKLYGYDLQAVQALMKHLGVPRRSFNVAALNKKKKPPRWSTIPKEDLCRMYVEEKLTVAQIAKQYGYAKGSKTLFSRLLKRYGIPLRGGVSVGEKG